jgi:hypothetical protein
LRGDTAQPEHVREEIMKAIRIHEFGDPDVHEWTTIEMDLEAWVQRELAEEQGPA